MRIARRRTAVVSLLPVALAGLLAACGSGGSSSPGAASGFSHNAGQGKFIVIAAENFWGSIAAQLAGDKAAVQSIIVNPSTDPHSYQPTAQDARTIAEGKLEIVNGIGYDKWMTQSIAANPVSGRIVLTVGDLLGLKEGDNAHQWYSPSSVLKVVNELTSNYSKLDARDAGYFAQRKQTFLTQDLAQYNQLRARIRARYARTPVGYSESIFRPLGADLGLRLLTPYTFTKAIAEGTEVSAQDKQTVDSQAQHRQIKVWVYNRQNVTPDVQRVTSIVNAQHIPIATVTETLSPATLSFEQWQVAELRGLMTALHQATGR